MFQCCLNPNSFNQFLYLGAIQGHSGDNAFDPALQDNVHLPRREHEWVELQQRKWTGSRKKKPQERKTSSILHYSEPDRRRFWYGRNSTRLDETKDRAIQEYMGSSPKREACNFHQTRSTCRRSLQDTDCLLHWESGMYENSGWAPPERSLNSESATSRAKIDLAIWSTRSTNQDAGSSWEPSRRFEKLRVNLSQHRGSQNTAKYNTWEQGQEVYREVWEPQA